MYRVAVLGVGEGHEGEDGEDETHRWVGGESKHKRPRKRALFLAAEAKLRLPGPDGSPLRIEISKAGRFMPPMVGLRDRKLPSWI